MSSKRNKSNKDDNFFMAKFKLGFSKFGLTGENPSVGCVLIKNNQIISAGVTGIKWQTSLEVNAIKILKKKVNNSTLYVTLEPCNHYGKTPPCTNYIKNKKN